MRFTINLTLTTSNQRERMLIAFAMLFGGLVSLSLWLQTRATAILVVWLVMLALAASAHLWLNQVVPRRDPLLLPIAVFLSLWGLLIITRVADNFVGRQLVWVIISVMALCAVAATRDRLRWLRRFKYTWLLASLLLLAATLLLGVNPTGAGARLWLSFAGLFLQPSEVLRLLMIAFLAAFFSERVGISYWRLESHEPVKPSSRLKANLLALRPLAPSFVMWLVALGLLATQQDLGAAALLLLVYAFMLYLATGRPLLPIIGIAMLLVAGAVGYFLSSRIAQRVDIWLNPWLDPQGSSFQIVQSLIAIASGNVFGQGPGQGRPDYVPAVHTDFPYTAIGEEYGLIGALALLALFAVLALRAWRIARQTQSAYVLLLSGGLGALFAMQVFVIVGGNLGLLPLTGVTLPFVSYGGSSLLVSLIAVGLLIRLSDDGPTRLNANSNGNSNGNGAESPPQAQPALGARSDFVLKTTPAQHSAARRGMLACAALFVILALGTGYWGVVAANSLTARDDNPRNVDAERAIARGPVLARDGAVLALSELSPPANNADRPGPEFARVYPHAEAAPVVGYYSLWHGVGGLERYADANLRGVRSSRDMLLHHVQSGQAFTTTLDMNTQAQLARALTGTVGAGIIMDWRSGEVLALVSTPTYDPNHLDAEWDALRRRPDAPLLNRVTQGLYQPGALLAWLLTEGMTTTSTVTVWNPQDRLELSKSVPFELENSAVPYPATATYSETIGQGTLRLTPLRVAVSAAQFAANHPVTPILTWRSAPANASGTPAALKTQLSVFAPTGSGKQVGWHVRITDSTVTVLAVELDNADANRLATLVQQLTPLP